MRLKVLVMLITEIRYRVPLGRVYETRIAISVGMIRSNGDDLLLLLAIGLAASRRPY